MNKIIWKIVLAVSLILIIVSGVNIYLLNREYQAGIHAYASLEEYAKIEEEPQEEVEAAKAPVANTEETVESKIPVHMDIDFDELASRNSDFVGWIYYEPLELSYPIVRGMDNDYYTHYTFEKEKNSSGAIFIDFLNKKDFSNYNTIIYGHNMRNGTMFGSLKKLLNDHSIVEENPYFYIFTKDSVMMYQICSVYITNDSSHTYDLTQTLDEQQQYVDYVKEVSDYFWEEPLFDKPVEEDLRMVTLSTCHGLHSTNRTIVHGVLIAKEQR